MNLRIVFIAICFFLKTFPVLSQMQLESVFAYKDSIIDKKPISSAVVNIGENILIWGINRYIRKSDFSYISINTMKNNVQTGFGWDNDGFQTNMFDHPYHGGFAHNAARQSGLKFWQCFPYTLGGSLIWETFLENEPPSMPDLISTSIGGMAVGEVTRRISEAIHFRRHKIIFVLRQRLHWQ